MKARLIFFGSDEIALPGLERLLAAHAATAELVAVWSQPDRPSGRGKKVQPNAVVQWAKEKGVAVFQPERLGEAEQKLLEEARPDLALVMAYGHILRKDFLAVPRLGFFNLHASLLPQLRGATPIEGALVSRLGKTGVSLQRVVPRLDAGPIVDAEEIVLSAKETRGSLREKVAAAGAPLLERIWPRLLAGEPGVPQDEARVSFTRKITRDDAAVDFAASAAEIAARVRALTPWPGVTFPWQEQLLKMGAAELAEEKTDATPGTILAAGRDGVRIATGDGVLVVTQLQRPGGNMLAAAAFLAGFPLPEGAVLESRPMAPLVRDGSPFLRKL